MSRERESRPGERAAEGLAKVTKSIVPPRIGAELEGALDKALWGLVSGEIDLRDLTPALQAWYAVARADGERTATRDEIRRLERERDLWYFVAHNPGKTPGDFYAACTAELWRSEAA